ncbi:MAG: NUDIX domain-containing protein [Patescibacteria group bacterium]
MLQHKPRSFLYRNLREAYYTVYNPLIRLYHAVLKPRGEGVKSFIFNGDKLLLVRIGYGHKSWVLPGGAVDGKETLEQAAIRETKEETGIELDSLTYVTKTVFDNNGAEVTNHFFVGSSEDNALIIDDQEIIDAGWFALHALPNPRREKLDKEIKLYNEWKHGRHT